MIRAIPQPLVSPLVASLVASPSGISGFAFPGETLTMGSGATSYQWFVNSDNRGTAQTLLLTVDDIGKTVTGIRNGITLPQMTVWKPQDVPGVQAFWWSRAGVLNSVSPDVAATDGQTVRRWVGQVSGGPADQTVGGDQPILRSTGQSGGPSLEWDGSTDNLDMSGTQLDLVRNKQTTRVFVGCRDTNPTGGSARHEVFLMSSGTAAGSVRLGIWTRDTSSRFVVAGRALDAEVTVSTTSANIASDNAYHVHTVEALWTGGVLRQRLDGSQVAEVALPSSNATSNTASLTGRIGSGRSGVNPANFFPGHMTVMIFADGTISATDRSRIERFIGLHGGLNIPIV